MKKCQNMTRYFAQYINAIKDQTSLMYKGSLYAEYNENKIHRYNRENAFALSL